MALVRKLFVVFLIIKELIDIAVGAAIIYLGVTIYQQLHGVDTSNSSVSGVFYVGIGTRRAEDGDPVTKPTAAGDEAGKHPPPRACACPNGPTRCA